MYQKYFKRLFDIIFSIAAVIILSPLIIVLSLLVRIKLGRPIVFKHKRPGLNEKIFTLYKFRTMTDQKNEQGELLPDDIRLTSFGKILRSTSLDELPELVNIIKGDMSIVGPRPLLIQYLPLYNEQQRRRHEVRPGLTGLAQINGRNSVSWDEKFNLDVMYVEKIRLLNDVQIIFRTIKKVLIREGINSNTAVTMEPFKGSAIKGDRS